MIVLTNGDVVCHNKMDQIVIVFIETGIASFCVLLIVWVGCHTNNEFTYVMRRYYYIPFIITHFITQLQCWEEFIMTRAVHRLI